MLSHASSRDAETSLRLLLGGFYDMGHILVGVHVSETAKMILFWEFWVVSVDVGGEIGDTGKSCLTSALQGLVSSEASMARWAGILVSCWEF